MFEISTIDNISRSKGFYLLPNLQETINRFPVSQIWLNFVLEGPNKLENIKFHLIRSSISIVIKDFKF